MPRLREFLEKLHAERNRKRSVDVSNIGTTATAVTGNINTENANNVPGDHVAAVNVGLLLRWECALARMEKYNEISITDQRLFVTKWNLFVSVLITNVWLPLCACPGFTYGSCDYFCACIHR